MEIGDRVRYSKAILDNCEEGRRYRASNERGTITNIESNATDTILWVRWDRDGGRYTTMPDEVEEATD